MITRNYTAADLDVCRELWVQLTETHRQIYDAPYIGGDNPGLQFDEQLAKVGPERIWVAEEDRAILGMIGLQPTRPAAVAGRGDCGGQKIPGLAVQL